MCLYLIEQGGDRGILDANSRGYIPAEVTSNKDIGKLELYWEMLMPTQHSNMYAWTHNNK